MIPSPVNVLYGTLDGVEKSEEERNPTEVTRPQTTIDTTKPWEPSGLKSVQTTQSLARRQQNTALKITFK
ncbi:MAG TPA: hypothetical protein VN223_10220 [Candidatus Elarobacter sp.]|nr:hypothetical protein [Candidatus Elarobacter sp.]